jgi:rRNA maturation endonuclease Nob1
VTEDEQALYAEQMDAWHRRILRERRGGYHAGWRCWGCKRFVSGPNSRCGSCGQEHGGVFHEAYATR